jgi:hypothetical protein
MSGTTSPPTASAMLEELRQRIRSQYAPPPETGADRLTAFGRGVLSNRGSFLDNLTAGVSAQEQAAAARADQQRRALDMERQALEVAARAENERNRLAQSQSQFEAEGPVREARIRSYNAQAAQAGRTSYNVIGVDAATGFAVVADPTAPSGTRVLQGVTPTQIARAERQVDAATDMRARAAAARALENARTRAASMAQTLAPDEERRIYDTAYQQNLNPAAAPAAPQGPRPSQTLQYPRPAQ